MIDIWTVYDHPSDWPHGFVARKFVLDQPTNEVFKASTLGQLRAMLPEGLTCLARSEQDDPVIVECWL